jgi:hypothetical protein
MAMSTTTKAAANIAGAVISEIQGGNQNYPMLLQWLAAAVIAACQADGGNAPTINVPWPGGVPGTIIDNATVNVTGQ